MKREHAVVWLTALLASPAIVLRLAGTDLAHHQPLWGMIVFGGAIVASAFLLTWAAEIAEMDINPNLAIVFVALVAVLPEYAVDMYFAWTAGADPQYTHYALANMTGANRLLLGCGWALVMLVAWWKFRSRDLDVGRSRICDVLWLSVATAYSVIIPLKGSLSLLDTLFFFVMFALYVRAASKMPQEEPELVGVAAVLGALPKRRRRTVTAAMFLFSAVAIVAAAEPFAESLIHGGSALGIDKFFLVQWLAPLASEAPEFLVAIILALRGTAAKGLGALISSKVNQWTLLVGMVPVVYALSTLTHTGTLAWGMPIDARQCEELVLTIAQGLYGVGTLLDRRFTIGNAIVLGALFWGQLAGTVLLERLGHQAWVTPFHYGVSVLYFVLAAGLFFRDRRFVWPLLRDGWNPMAADPPSGTAQSIDSTLNHAADRDGSTPAHPSS